MNKSLFFMDADQSWKRIRTIVSPAFTNGKLKTMQATMERISNRFVNQLRPFATEGSTFDLKPTLGGLAMDLLACCCYGIEIDSINQTDHPTVVNAKKILAVDNSLKNLFPFFMPRIAGKYFGMGVFNKDAVKFFDQLTFDIIEKRMKNCVKSKLWFGGCSCMT